MTKEELTVIAHRHAFGENSCEVCTDVAALVDEVEHLHAAIDAVTPRLRYLNSMEQLADELAAALRRRLVRCPCHDYDWHDGPGECVCGASEDNALLAKHARLKGECDV